MHQHLPLVLMILDGWGYRTNKAHNAIAAAHTPQWDHWWATRPHMLLEASGPAVGLPDEQMGNSEVGHMHIGAGQIILQNYTRINQAIETGEYAHNPLFLQMLHDMKHQNRAIHVLGLLSDGGVHSHEAHLFAFLALCAKEQFSNVHLHLFLDGRDTSPHSALQSLERLQTCLQQYPTAKISSLSGRYFAMDRDKRWERIEPVYELLTEGKSAYCFSTAHAAIQHFYATNISDEFIPPTRIGEKTWIQDGDSVFFFNFRADRARQLSQTLITDNFTGFCRKTRPHLRHFISMTHYADDLATQAAFSPHVLNNTLGEMIAKQGLRQLRIAETEKYAHVTFFLNGGQEQQFPKEERMLIPSPPVATYDLQPEMSAKQLTQAIVNAIDQQLYDVIICNYANADMVGHSGNFAATVQAIECLDQAMQTIWHALEPLNGQLLITADHGNAESMFDDAIQQAHTAHTNEPVPFMYIGPSDWQFNTTTGSLIDIAPTILTLLGITPPVEMIGEARLVR